jgi:hypothetical protein
MMFAKASLAIAAAALSISTLVAAPAAAQQASAQVQTRDANGYYYDPCQRSTVNRTTGGSLLGAAIGAAVGSGIAGKNNKTEGAVLGGVLGAVMGANTGKSSAACGQTKTYDRQAYNNGYDNDGGYEVYSTQVYRGYSPYQSRRDHGYRGYDHHRDYGRTIAERSNADQCTLAESPIYMPDGSVQKRFVRVCADANGRYQVVQ